MLDTPAQTGKAVSELFSRIGDEMHVARVVAKYGAELEAEKKQFEFDYCFHTSRRMVENPWRIRAAITGETWWYSDVNDLSDLEEKGNDKLDNPNLWTLDRLDVIAALGAIQEIRQLREEREERGASLIRDNNAGRRG